MTSDDEMTSCYDDHKLVIYSSNICFEKGNEILISYIISFSLFLELLDELTEVREKRNMRDMVDRRITDNIFTILSFFFFFFRKLNFFQ